MSGSAPATQVLYRVSGGSGLLWRQWDEDEVLVFHSASGRTHLLDAVSAEVLRELEGSSATLDELVKRLGDRFDLETEALPRRVLEVCGRLKEIGLVDRDAA